MIMHGEQIPVQSSMCTRIVAFSHLTKQWMIEVFFRWEIPPLQQLERMRICSKKEVIVFFLGTKLISSLSYCFKVSSLMLNKSQPKIKLSYVRKIFTTKVQGNFFILERKYKEKHSYFRRFFYLQLLCSHKEFRNLRSLLVAAGCRDFDLATLIDN